jgi:hypothetical protein
MMGDLVLSNVKEGKLGSDLLAKSYGGENLIDKEVKKRETFYKIIIPIFHHSLAQT